MVNPLLIVRRKLILTTVLDDTVKEQKRIGSKRLNMIKTSKEETWKRACRTTCDDYDAAAADNDDDDV